MNFLPLFLNIHQQPCLVVGGGSVATRKVDLLLKSSAKVHIIAPELTPQLTQLLHEGKLTHQTKTFDAADLDLNYRLVLAATPDKTVNQQVYTLAHARGLLVNVADQPQLCNFILPSIIDRDPVQIAVSTGGASPVLARLLRSQLETLIPSNYGQLARFVAQYRTQVQQQLPSRQRRSFWETVLQSPIVERVFSGQHTQASQELEELLAHTCAQSKSATVGEVYLVGGGPGDPDLLTFRALRLMQQADVVLYDRLVAPEILNLVRREAERIYVGKQPTEHPVPQPEINQLLIQLAKQGKRVLRLKGGDPFMFGRGGEEIERLMEEGIPFQVVPGITAAMGTSAYAGIPLTHRDYAQSCLFVTAQFKEGSPPLNWKGMIQPQQTLVIYMGVRALPNIAQNLMDNGLAPDTPAALIQKATTSDQRILVGSISSLPGLVQAAEITMHSIIIIGEVVKLHQKLAWFTPFKGGTD